jgi:tetratricopeptide (TPR) repeat protein
MWLYWWLRGQYSVGRRRAEDCLCTDLPPELVGRAHLTAATMAYAAGDVRAGADHWTQASRVGEALHDRGLECTGRAGQGLACLTAGDLESAERELRRALELGYELADDGIWITALVHVWLGTLLLLHADPEEATAEMERGLALARGRGDLLTSYVALFNLAQARIAAGEPAQARAHLEEGVILAARAHDVSALAYLLDGLAGLGSPDSPDRVAVLLGAAKALRETVGPGAYAHLRPDKARRAAAERAAREALGADAFDHALETGRTLTVPEAVAFALDA